MPILTNQSDAPEPVDNADGDLIQTIDPRGNSTLRFARPAALDHPDPSGNLTRLEYDDQGNMTGVRNTDGVTMVTSGYNPFGEVSSVRPAAGRTTHFDYTTGGDQAAAWYFR